MTGQKGITKLEFSTSPRVGNDKTKGNDRGKIKYKKVRFQEKEKPDLQKNFIIQDGDVNQYDFVI